MTITKTILFSVLVLLASVILAGSVKAEGEVPENLQDRLENESHIDPDIWAFYSVNANFESTDENIKQLVIDIENTEFKFKNVVIAIFGELILTIITKENDLTVVNNYGEGELYILDLIRFVSYTVTTQDLYEEFSTNVLRAERKYNDSFFIIIGKVKNIGKDRLRNSDLKFYDKYFVQFDLKESEDTIFKVFIDENNLDNIEDLTTGDMIFIEARYDEYYAPYLNFECKSHGIYKITPMQAAELGY
jgi:hypothetical protein